MIFQFSRQARNSQFYVISFKAKGPKVATNSKGKHGKGQKIKMKPTNICRPNATKAIDS